MSTTQQIRIVTQKHRESCEEFELRVNEELARWEDIQDIKFTIVTHTDFDGMYTDMMTAFISILVSKE